MPFAELRFVAEPLEAVERVEKQHQLGSNLGLIERFPLDVGLWVVPEAVRRGGRGCRDQDRLGKK